MQLADGTTIPYQHLVGMDTWIGPDGDPQVGPSEGYAFVGYLYLTESLETLRAQARSVWGVYPKEQAEDGGTR